MEEYKAKVIWEYGRCKGQLLVDISEQAKLLGQPHKWMSFDLEYKEPFTENPFLVISRECGEWIYHKEWELDGECAFECSKCGRCVDVDYNFCPNCGYPMKKEDKPHGS